MSSSLLAKNSFYSSISISARFLSNAVLFIIIARALGAEEFGMLSFGLSFTGIFLVIVDYGYNLLAIREIAMSPNNVIEISNEIISGKIMLAGIASIFVVLTIKFLGYAHETELIVYILGIAGVFYSFGFFFNNIFRALNRFHYESYSTLFLNGVQFILVVFMLLLKYKSLSIALVYLISRILYFLLSLHLARKNIGKFTLSFNLLNNFKNIRKALPFGMFSILAMYFLQLGTLFVSYFKGNAEVGYYQAAMRIVLAAMIINEVIVSAYYPVLAKTFFIDKSTFKENGQSLVKFMLLLGGSIASFFVLYSKTFVTLLYGQQYGPSVQVMQFLAVVIVLRFLAVPYGLFTTIAKKQKFRVIGIATALLFNIILNFMLIPKYGALGAAISNIITHAILLIIYMLFSFNFTGFGFWDRYCYRGTLILCIGLAVCLFMKNLALSVFIFSTFAVLLIQVSLNPSEKQIIKYLFNKIHSKMVDA